MPKFLLCRDVYEPDIDIWVNLDHLCAVYMGSVGNKEGRDLDGASKTVKEIPALLIALSTSLPMLREKTDANLIREVDPERIEEILQILASCE